MKAVFTLTPAESKRLLAKAIVQMPEVKTANEKGYVILAGGTTNAYIAQEMLGIAVEPQRFTAGICTRGLVCVTDVGDRHNFPIAIRQGQVTDKTMLDALKDFHNETVIIKGGNAVDPEGNVGVITSGFDGGTMGNSLGIMTSTGLRYITPVGLEKLVASVKDATYYTGAKTFDYSMGANFGMFILTKAIVVTEIQALKILCDVEVKHVASGGIGGAEGAVVLVIMGPETNVQKAIALLESIKGEPRVAPIKGTCARCLYACRFKGMAEADLPAWLRVDYHASTRQEDTHGPHITHACPLVSCI
jgi:hypothetical protein